MNEKESRQRLAAAVKADRMRLHRTVDAARVAAHISRGAWENVEAGRSVKEFTLGAIEQALEWPAGKAQSILDGTSESAVEAAIQDSDLRPEIKARLLRIIADELPPSDGQGVKGA